MGWGSVDGLGFKFFYEEVGYNRTDRGTHGCTMYLFIILTLEKELVILRDKIPAARL